MTPRPGARAPLSAALASFLVLASFAGLGAAGCTRAPAPTPTTAVPAPAPAPAPDARAAGSARAVDEDLEVALDGETMGSTWRVKLRVSSERAAEARALQAPIDALLERVNDQMSTYRPTSEISRFNAHASTAPFPVSPAFAAVTAKALEVGAKTDGAYDITLDPLINLWGFDRKGPRTTPPTPAEIAAARAHTGLGLVRVEEARAGNGPALVKLDPAVTINLGGIAAGWAVDEIARLLSSRALNDFMIEVTGEVRAKGRNARGQPWKIGVKVPDIDSNEVVASVPLDDRALTTSGSYHNFFEARQKRYHHILDPKTGAPAVTDLVSVTVLSSDAMTADGYDTPFLILGEERAREIVAATPGMAALFIHQDPATGKLTQRATAGFPPLDVVAP